MRLQRRITQFPCRIMRTAILHVVLLVAACVLGDAALYVFIARGHDAWPDLPGVFGLGLGLAQVTLVAAALVWGGWNLALRTVAALAALFGLAHLVALSSSDEQFAVWYGFLLAYLAVLVVVMGGVRYRGYWISLSEERRPRRRLPGWQFSIGGLLSLTTSVALVLAVRQFIDFPFGVLGFALWLLTVISANSLISFFCAFQSPPSAAIAVLLITGPLLGWFYNIEEFASSQSIKFMILGAVQSLAVAGGVGALRLAGFRWVPPRHAGDAGEPQDTPCQESADDPPPLAVTDSGREGPDSVR